MNAWGSSWGASWGASWGGGVPPAPQDEAPGAVRFRRTRHEAIQRQRREEDEALVLAKAFLHVTEH